jgi:hypothetical protein
MYPRRESNPRFQVEGLASLPLDHGGKADRSPARRLPSHDDFDR